jgi:hypothetical protein
MTMAAGYLGRNTIHPPAPCGRGLGGGVSARKRARESIVSRQSPVEGVTHANATAMALGDAHISRAAHGSFERVPSPFGGEGQGEGSRAYAPEKVSPQSTQRAQRGTAATKEIIRRRQRPQHSLFSASPRLRVQFLDSRGDAEARRFALARLWKGHGNVCHFSHLQKNHRRTRRSLRLVVQRHPNRRRKSDAPEISGSPLLSARLHLLCGLCVLCGESSSAPGARPPTLSLSPKGRGDSVRAPSLDVRELH